MTGSRDPDWGRYGTALQALETLPAALRAARTHAGMSFRAAEQAIGVARSRLSRFEAGRTSPDRIDLATVVKILTFVHNHPVDPVD